MTVIVTFHSTLLTKIDKAYMLQCYYKEKIKTVITELEIRCVDFNCSA